MFVGTIVKDPDADEPVQLDITPYLADDSFETVAWSIANGMTVEELQVDTAITSALLKGGQEGCDYLATVHATFGSGATEDFTIRVKVRTLGEDPRLVR